MDNLTHTLVGAALAESGLKRRTALGTATLMIGANFPDIDVIAVPLGMGVEWRRGATHGFLALAILPFVLAGIMLLWDRQVRRRRDPSATPADYRQLALLSAIAIATHPTLDFMNTYGMRWLMPFSDKPFYADGLFIVDLWIFVILSLGVFWSRRAKSTRPARIALVTLATYTVAMLVITGIGRAKVAAEFPGRRFMVQPNGMVPWRREVLVELDEGYKMGTYRLFGALGMRPDYSPKISYVSSQLYSTEQPAGDGDPAIQAARKQHKVERFLRWARFPMYEVDERGSQTVVRVGDARYEGANWASVTVRLP